MIVDYLHEDSQNLRPELSVLREKINTLKKEQESAMSADAGLNGPVAAAGEEISSLQLQISNMERRISIVDQGFPFFDKFGFENALDACGMVYGWETLAEDFDVVVFGFKDTKIRLPEDVQKKYISTVRLRLFNTFAICWAFEPEDDESIAPEKIDYYLFGSPKGEPSEDIFLIAQWST
jgi:hypothetical protein